MMAFVGAVSLHQGWLGAFLGIEVKGTSPKLYVAAALVPCVLSCLFLCAGVAVMVGRFMWL